jgi:hypothetical protein
MEKVKCPTSPARTSRCDRCFARAECRKPVMPVEHEAEV